MFGSITHTRNPQQTPKFRKNSFFAANLDASDSIPVINVPGPGISYPLNLSYHAGIQANQEATWVGLGWSLNPGAITRDVNGIPDDFAGEITREYICSQTIYGWYASVMLDGATLGVQYNSETGLSGTVGYSFGMQGSAYGIDGSVGFDGKGISSVDASASLSGGAGSANLGFGWSRGKGLGLTGGLGVSAQIANGGSADQSISGGAHLGFDTRSGINGSIGLRAGQANRGTSLGSMGASLTKTGLSGSVTTAASIEVNTVVNRNTKMKSANYMVPFWTPWTGYGQLNWGHWSQTVSGDNENLKFGYINQANYYKQDQSTWLNSQHQLANNTGSVYYLSPQLTPDNNSINRMMDVSISIDTGARVTINGSVVYFNLGSTGEDFYNINGQGISGAFGPQARQYSDFYKTDNYLTNYNVTHSSHIWGLVTTTNSHTDVAGMAQYLENGTDGPNSNHYIHGPMTTADMQHWVTWKMKGEVGGGAQGYDNADSLNNSGNVITSNRITPVISNNRIVGWTIIKSDGTIYNYNRPLASLSTTIYSVSYRTVWLKGGLVAATNADQTIINNMQNCSVKGFANSNS